MKPQLLCSFSGGKTSAYMSKKILDEWCDLYDIITVFANTGCEHEETLNFVNKCDIEFGLNVVWVEAVVNTGRTGTGYKIVNFKNASRDGKPFIDMSKKYGLPNSSYPHCTMELKLRPINSYLDDIGFSKCLKAIGIRSDEESRRAKNAKQENIIYPLLDNWPTDKEDINIFWENQDFNLKLPAYMGNCVWCWKKTDNKHFRIIHENKEIYDFPLMLDRNYSMNGNGSDIRDQGERKMFRKHRSTKDMIDAAHLADYETLKNIVDSLEPSGCVSSCEMYGECTDKDKP